MEDKSLTFPVYMSGEPADMPVIEERLGTVQHAACSSSEEGQKPVQKHAINRLKQKTEKLGGNAIIDVTTDYGAHPDLSKKCPFGVFVSGTAVVLEN